MAVHAQFNNTYPTLGTDHNQHWVYWASLMAALVNYFKVGTIAARPATPPASTTGAYYFASDIKALYIGVSGAWVEVGARFMGSATLAADQNTTSTTYVDVAGLSVAWTGITGRTYEVRFEGASEGTGVAGAPTHTLAIHFGGAVVREVAHGSAAANAVLPRLIYVVTGVGALTAKIQHKTSAGTSSIEGDDATRRPILYVKDIT